MQYSWEDVARLLLVMAGYFRISSLMYLEEHFYSTLNTVPSSSQGDKGIDGFPGKPGVPGKDVSYCFLIMFCGCIPMFT